MNWYRTAANWDKMREFFETRTNKHIELVAKYCRKIAQCHEISRDGVEILERIKDHDQSKFKDPEMEPYVYTTWNYKCKDDGIKFDIPEDMKDRMTEATEHHVKNNSHHPEYHCDKETNLVNAPLA